MARPATIQENERKIDLMAKDVGYLNENFKRLEKTVSDGFDEVKKLMKEQYATKDEVQDLRKSIDKYDGYSTWFVRLVLGVVVLAVLGLIFIPAT